MLSFLSSTRTRNLPRPVVPDYPDIPSPQKHASSLKHGGDRIRSDASFMWVARHRSPEWWCWDTSKWRAINSTGFSRFTGRNLGMRVCPVNSLLYSIFVWHCGCSSSTSHLVRVIPSGFAAHAKAFSRSVDMALVRKLGLSNRRSRLTGCYWEHIWPSWFFKCLRPSLVNVETRFNKIRHWVSSDVYDVSIRLIPPALTAFRPARGTIIVLVCKYLWFCEIAVLT